MQSLFSPDTFAHTVGRVDALQPSAARQWGKMTPAQMRPPRFISGKDLIGMGFKPGPAFKNILQELEDLQLDGALADRDEALDYLRQHYPAPGN